MIYLDYFWYIKYQHISIYMKMGKGNGKRKRKREKQLAGPGGEISAHPGARACARARLRPSCGPRARETARARGSDSVTAGPPVSESGGGETALRSDGAGEPAEQGEKSAAGGLDGGSPPVARFLVHGEVD
jgi:hypothetical protein